MTKVRVQDATRELSTNAGRMLESISQMRKKTQDMLGNLRKISGDFAREAPLLNGGNHDLDLSGLNQG